MIVDVTGVELTPGAEGKYCLGNGEHAGVECCCDECDYLQCCLENHDIRECLKCSHDECPNARQGTI